MYHHHVVVTSTTLVVVAFCFLCISWVAQGGESFVIEQKQWDFLQKHDVGYEVAKAAVAPSIATTSSSASSIATAESSITRMMSNDNGTATEKTTKIETISTVTAASWTSSQSTPILLLNGFGVGSFHQHRLIERFFAPSLLSSSSRLSSTSSTSTSTVYCMDYLGQGRSWPKDCQDGRSPNEDGLQYSAEMWVQQIIQFIEDIIRPSELKETACASSSSASISGTGRLCKVHVVGNSVGGHLAAHIAARRPDLVESIVLLNPTPVWGLNLPGWSGHLPPPPIPRLVGRFLFDRIRDLRTIESFLRETYSRRNAFSDELMHQIRGCTEGNGGHAAFASIMWSPPLEVPTDGRQKGGNFQECLSKVSCDVLLVFGKDDPWCKPAFARKMILALDKRDQSKVHRYVEISNAGHCPNHEAPTAVSHLLRAWTSADDRRSESLTLVDDDQNVFEEGWGQFSVEECDADDIQVGLIDRLAITFVS